MTQASTVAQPDTKNSPLADSAITSPVIDYLKHLHQSYAEVQTGNVATYIPELAKANPDWFGICIVTAGGHVYEVGDSQQEFTIQSISKPFVYGMALEDNTRAVVMSKVGVEPTGDVFNAISLEQGTGRPRNPMINAGAIATAGLIAGKTQQIRFNRVLQTFSALAGRTLKLDEEVYRSESETGHRNRAIGHMLRNFDILTEPPEPVVDLYFKQCSISVTCRDLAVMAATLANRGINPVTGKQAMRGEYVESVLSVMGSCGMYDYAGEWIYRVGMPAKSGVAGGIIAVLPGQMGIGVFSPRLDEHGNSVRGIKVCDAISRHLDLHLFNTPLAGRSVIRLRFNGAEVNSSRVRTAEESKLLREHGRAILAYQLQGQLAFSTADVVVRDIMDKMAGMEYLVLDFKHTLGLNESASHLIYDLVVKLAEMDKPVLFTNTGKVPGLRRYMRIKLKDRFERLYQTFPDMDPALEWCENQILGQYLPVWSSELDGVAEDFELFEGLDAKQREVIKKLLVHKKFQRGEVIVRFGDEAKELFFLRSGSTSVTVTLASGQEKRIATFSPGMAFGEMAMLDRAPRSAVVTADTDVTCELLTLDDFEAMGKTHPDIKITLLRNLALGLCRKLRKANREISVYDY